MAKEKIRFVSCGLDVLVAQVNDYTMPIVIRLRTKK